MINTNEIESNITDASALLKSFSNEKRLHVICALYDGEKNVGELEGIIDLSQSALSQHLARLRRDDVVVCRREAQTVFYSLKDKETTEKILSCIHSVCC